jgi:3-phenylpropionate/trans-cinnamate dioxygenase ferredoxin subunit
MSQPDYVPVARAAELPPGARRVVAVGQHAVLLVNVDGTVYATPDACPHRLWPLSQSEQHGSVLKCARHGWEFDVVSGKAVYPPFGYRLHTLPVQIVDETIHVAWTEPEVEPAH